MAADLGDKATDASTLVTLAEIAKRHDDARSTLLIGKTALGRGLPFEHYAFPAFGMPNYQQIGPGSRRRWSIRSRGRKVPSTRAWSRAPMRSA
jgi:hypothetical protein